MFGAEAYSDNVAQAKLNPNVVGKPAEWIAEQAGFNPHRHQRQQIQISADRSGKCMVYHPCQLPAPGKCEEIFRVYA